jgi:hypothetical protein
MNTTLETLEGRRLMSASPTQAAGEAAALSKAGSAQILPYLEQGNLYKQAQTAGTVPQGIIAILIGLRTTPRAPLGGNVAAGDVNNDGVAASSAASSTKAITMTEVLIAARASNNAYAGVFAGATGAGPVMIGNVSDGTSNTSMWA